MSKVNFDEHAHSYRESLKSSLGLFGKKENFFDLYKIYCIKKWVLNNNQSYDILDYGCGIGKLSSFLAKEFSQSTVYGYDISVKSLSVAMEENAWLKNIHFINGLSEERKYDFVIASNVFHHVKPDERVSVLTRIRKILKPDGKIIIFEHNPYNPLTRYIVNACPFDADAELILRNKFVELALTCGLKIDHKPYILFFPLASNLLRRLEHYLRHIPLGAQYMLVLMHRQFTS